MAVCHLVEFASLVVLPEMFSRGRTAMDGGEPGGYINIHHCASNEQMLSTFLEKA